MVIRLFYLLLFGAVPMIFPFSIFVLFKSAYFLNTQIEYSKSDLEAGLDEVTERTIQIRTIAGTEGLPISPSSWVFHVAEEKPKLALSKKRSPKKKENKIVDKLVAQAAEIYSPPFDVIESKQPDISEEDPFLKEWKEKKGEGYSDLSIQKRLDNHDISEREGYRVAQADMDIQTKPVNPKSQPPKSQPEERPVSPKKIIADGRESEASFLNIDMTDGGYLSYTTVEGEVVLISQDVVECFYEVSFYDRLNENGVDDEFSTVIASQEIRDKSKQFILRIPSESSGVLVAKAYSLDDVEKKSPIYLGTYEKKPLMISKQGAKNLKIALYPRDEYLSQYLTLLSGKIYNEYAPRDQARCVSNASVWVLELNQHTTTNEQCVFEIKGMALGVQYHLLFEKEGFAALEIPIKLQQKRESHVFYMAPMTKFTQGYDLLLGARNPDKSVLFATIYKGGKPLERAIVKTPQSEKVVYERISDLGSFPDETLFSSMSNGKVTLWNVDPGKVSLDVFYNGAHLGRRLVRLIPGITHQIKIDF